jgi:hypothetical protein
MRVDYNRKNDSNSIFRPGAVRFIDRQAETASMPTKTVNALQPNLLKASFVNEPFRFDPSKSLADNLKCFMTMRQQQEKLDELVNRKMDTIRSAKDPNCWIQAKIRPSTILKNLD